MEELSFVPVDREVWGDMQKLFGEKGAYGGCWCTYWRIRTSEFSSSTNSRRKKIMADFIGSGGIPGLLAYSGKEPVGWCSIGPREEFVRLESSRILKRVDEKPVWSIVCFYIQREHRKMGIMKALLTEAVKYAVSKGARIVEGYPVDPEEKSYPDPFAYTGLFTSFKEAGFKEVERRSDKRPIMRFMADDS